MKYEFEKVLDGVSNYINNSNLYSGMNDWQELIARMAIGRVYNNAPAIKDYLINNGYVRTFGIIDGEGMIDIESLLGELKSEISRKEKLTISIPVIGKLTFKPEDVDALHRSIAGGGTYENN